MGDPDRGPRRDTRVRQVLAYFNNHPRGSAVRNAEMLEAMLAEQIPDQLALPERSS